MDPSQLDGASLILGALAAGAGDGLKMKTKDAVTAAVDGVGRGGQALYHQLVQLLTRRVACNEDAAADLNVHLRRPSEESADALQTHFVELGLDQDAELLAIAREIVSGSPTAIGQGAVAANTIRGQANDNAHSHIGGVQIYQQNDPH
ncbi:hypothetical protein [Gordonia sp. AC31]|uniref:hypothetical protein n=1 Tax=Gordonia sp. AC31 TaxID=2962571 RepID=UPI002881C9F5|nr:hypothetical protein [Gordonia sp. AC31]MDT0219967.1 hypothetical protein [Gordonia sp. AC31]